MLVKYRLAVARRAQQNVLRLSGSYTNAGLECLIALYFSIHIDDGAKVKCLLLNLEAHTLIQTERGVSTPRFMLPSKTTLRGSTGQKHLFIKYSTIVVRSFVLIISCSHCNQSVTVFLLAHSPLVLFRDS